jgi:hypothetical protein
MLLICGILFRPGPLSAQSAVVSRIKEKIKPDLALYFYPSTLRMINLSDNEDFDRLVRDIRKIRFFKWSRENYAEIDESSLIRDLREENFEAYMTVHGGAMDLKVYGREVRKQQPEIVAIVETEDGVQLLEIQGMIHVARIPALINNLNTDNFINVFVLDKKKEK